MTILQTPLRTQIEGAQTKMKYQTADGHTVTDETLEAEAQLFEKGERPSVWSESEPPKQVNTALPAWVVNVADAEASRLNISRRAVLNIWLAEKAEEAILRYGFNSAQ